MIFMEWRFLWNGTCKLERTSCATVFENRIRNVVFRSEISHSVL